MEKRDLYDEKRNLTGETIYKGEPVPDGKYIIVVLIFIQNSDGKIMIQKRSKQKGSTYAATGGHPKTGETSRDGIITEVKEELGLDISNENLIVYYSGMWEQEHVFCDCYYLKKDIDLNDINLQKDEVDSVYWFSIDEVNSLIDEGKFFPNNIFEFGELVKWLKNNKNI